VVLAGDQNEPNSKSALLALLDSALALQVPLVERHIGRLRRNRPDAPPVAILKRLNREFRATTVSAGLGVGAVAASPRVSRRLALSLSGAEVVGYFNAAALYVLSRAELHGTSVDDIEGRRTLVMAIMLGEAGAKSVERVAERTGQHWARQLVKKIPQHKIKAVNDVLGRHFVTKYGTKEGIVVLGRVVPFGIGAVIGGTANAFSSQAIIKAADRAFGAAPDAWPKTERDGATCPVGDE
jgi:hypothetical protein